MRQTAPRVLLGLAAVAIMFAAADTYVVVLALPDMMTTVGLDIDQLQRAAPIVSGFLLGYVAVLPLIGRISDLRGRVPVLLGCLHRLRHRLGHHRRRLRPAQHRHRPAHPGHRRRRTHPAHPRAGRRPVAAGASRAPARRSSARCRSSAASSARSTARSSSPSGRGATSSGSTAPSASCSPPRWSGCATPMQQAPDRPGRLDVVGLGLGCSRSPASRLVMLEPDGSSPASPAAWPSCRSSASPGGSRRSRCRRSASPRCSCVRQATARRPLLDWRDWAGLGRETDLRGALMLHRRPRRDHRRVRLRRAGERGDLAERALAAARSPRSRSPGSGGASAPRPARWFRAAPSARVRPGARSSCRSSSGPASSPRSSTSRSSPGSPSTATPSSTPPWCCCGSSSPCPSARCSAGGCCVGCRRTCSPPSRCCSARSRSRTWRPGTPSR